VREGVGMFEMKNERNREFCKNQNSLTRSLKIFS